MRWPSSRDPLNSKNALQNEALASLARQVPLWGPDEVRQHLLNIAEMGFWSVLSSPEPVEKSIQLSLQWYPEASMMGPHTLANPFPIWGYRDRRSSGSSAPYSGSGYGVEDTEVPAVYWPIANRYDEPCRPGQDLAFWKTVLNHPQVTLSHASTGREGRGSLSATFQPSPDRRVEPWTGYFAAWMDVRERLGRNAPHETAMLLDHHTVRQWQRPDPWTPSPDAPRLARVQPRRPRR